MAPFIDCKLWLNFAYRVSPQFIVWMLSHQLNLQYTEDAFCSIELLILLPKLFSVSSTYLTLNDKACVRQGKIYPSSVLTSPKTMLKSLAGRSLTMNLLQLLTASWVTGQILCLYMLLPTSNFQSLLLSLVWCWFQSWANILLWWTLHVTEISEIPKEVCGMCEKEVQLMGRKLCAKHFLLNGFGFTHFILPALPLGSCTAPCTQLTNTVC